MEKTWEQLLRDAVNVPGIISEAYSRFHGYSIGNQMLALIRCHIRGVQPGPIASFMHWKTLGRSVKKGAKAIALWMPITGKRTKEIDGRTNRDRLHTIRSQKSLVRSFRHRRRRICSASLASVERSDGAKDAEYRQSFLRYAERQLPRLCEGTFRRSFARRCLPPENFVPRIGARDSRSHD